MEQPHIYLISLAIILFIFFILKFFISKAHSKNLPPSPPSLPILGHLHLLKKPLHRTLHHLSETYGPVYLLRFGSRPVLVVSNPSQVEECLTKNDVIFANRPRLLSGKHLNYNYNTIGASSYGHLWRNLRRVATVELLSPTRINMFLDIRREEVKMLVKNLFIECRINLGFTKVEMQSRCSELSFNVIMRMVAGNRYFGNEGNVVEEAKRFRKLIKEIFKMGAYPGDFLPILRWIDYNNREKRMLVLRDKVDTFTQRLIEEHRSRSNTDSGDKSTSKTMIDGMLSLQDSDPQYNSDEIIKGMIMTMLSAGTDTTSVTIEWAMSLLLNNPEILNKALLEINDCIGHDRLVDENDLSKLPYIQSIVNETLRLFPAAPLLLPHESSEACTIGGYNIPCGTILFVNAWAIHRDPSIWEEPTAFKPERFSQGGGELGEEFKWVPFGMGRRRCPGGGLANKVVCLGLAALIQCFEWERVSVEPVDMLEEPGLSMPKAVPLEAMCKARQEMVHVLSQL